MNKSVLVLSFKDDPHADVICDYLDKSRKNYFRIDTDEFPLGYKVSFDSKNLEFKINTKEEEIVLDSSWNIWNRRVFDPNIEGVTNPGLRQMICDETKAMWKNMLGSHQGLVVNDPSANYRANNKIDQLIFANKFGSDINIPETLLTNDPERVIEFREKHDLICFKLQKGAVIEKEGTHFPIYTNLIDEKNMEYIDLVEKHPHLFQRYQDKTYEIRIVTVGSKSIGTTIHSQKSERSKIDFRRYDFENVTYEHLELPENVSEFCDAMLKNYGLHFGAFDFIFSEENGYTFLEVNPNGQWLWLEEYTGYPIGKEINDYISN
jgi:glutathione synthase/RimK-type ligase-like ATP-grasp enzyme